MFEYVQLRTLWIAEKGSGDGIKSPANLGRVLVISGKRKPCKIYRWSENVWRYVG